MAHTVVLYTTPTWPHCVHVKEYLSQKGISFKELNVAENEEAREQMFEKTGRMAVPVLDVDGNIVLGFDKEKLDNILVH